MARMPTFEEIREDFEREWQHLRHHETSAAPAAAAVTITATQENHMSLGTELHRFAAIAETLGEDTIAIFEAVASNPETRAGLVVLARMAGLPLTPGTITTAMGGLSTIENIWHTAQQAAAQQGAQPPAPPAAAPADSDPRNR